MIQTVTFTKCKIEWEREIFRKITRGVVKLSDSDVDCGFDKTLTFKTTKIANKKYGTLARIANRIVIKRTQKTKINKFLSLYFRPILVDAKI